MELKLFGYLVLFLQVLPMIAWPRRRHFDSFYFSISSLNRSNKCYPTHYLLLVIQRFLEIISTKER
jgi:hypothetical protein